MPHAVLLHGFTQTGRSWAEVGAALPETYTWEAPDLRGHGSAGARRPVELDAVVTDVAAALRGGGASATVLCGYSMGGRVALHVALRHPDLVGRLVLVGASPGIADGGERAARRADDEALADRLERDGLDAFLAEWAALPLWATQTPAQRARADAERRRNTPAGLATALRGLGTGALPTVWDRLHEITVSVALLAGERDEKFTRIARAMADRLPNAVLHVVPGAGHALHLQAPAAVAVAIQGTTIVPSTTG